MTRNEALCYRAAIEAGANAVERTDEEALVVKDIYPAWEVGVELAVDDRVRSNGKLYRVLQAHTTQEGWQPENAPALFVDAAAAGEYREIKDNMLPTEAFALGEIGWYKEKDNLWKSLIDANTYTPETYPAGWEQVTG